MKKNTFTAIATAIAIVCFSYEMFSESSKKYTPKLQRVTVYLQGAHLYYNESVNLQAGNNEIVFENISPDLSASSLQASCIEAVVMDIKHNLKYKEKIPVSRKYDREITSILDSLEELNYLIKDLDNKYLVLTTEKQMLLNNRIIKGEPLRDSLPLLRDGMSFLKEKLNSIYEQELKIERTKSKILKQKSKLNTRYNALLLLQSGTDNSNPEATQPIQQVIVTLYADAPIMAQINFNYFVQTANWIPIYDLQATSVNKNIQVKYFASVTQNTKLEWTNVPLTISTSNPNETNVKPELSPWYLNFVEYLKKYPSGYYNGLSNVIIPIQGETLMGLKDEKKKEDLKNESYLNNYVQITENLIRTEYEIKMKYTIPADGKTHKVLIDQKEMPMSMQFAAAPKVCTDAFLVARVTKWEDMNIIPGNARIYFDGGYVGEIYLNTSTTTDTLNIGLGRDKNIALTRKKINENYKTKIISDEKIETRTIELMVRNTKNIPIEIMIDDQIPVARGSDDIKVVLLNSDEAKLDPGTGKLTWNKKLKSKETEKITFIYEIRYPKGKVLAGL